MRCEATTHAGAPCAQPALTGERVCASHAGRCGARPGNRNALRHGLYSQCLTPDEKLDLVAARAIEGVDEEIAVTRLMILRALRQQDAPAEAYARLAEALCRQLRLRRHLDGTSADSLAGAFGTMIDEIGAELGLSGG
jgi:hypothetical protein